MSELESKIGHDPRKIVIGRLDALLREEFANEPYHNPEHSAEVDNLSHRICEQIKEIDPSLVSDQEELGREAACKGHDSVVDYVDAIEGAQAGQRVRRRGFLSSDIKPEARAAGTVVGNERASALKIIRLIDTVDPHHVIYKEEALVVVDEAVAATYPDFVFEKLPDEKRLQMDSRVKKYLDPEGKGLRCCQPHLKPESSVAVLSVALADLSCGGILPVEITLEKGDAEYRETRDRIGYRLKEGITKMSEDQKKEAIADMEKWMKVQVQFFAWRKVETERVIDEHKFRTSEEDQKKIKQMFKDIGVFKRFDELITAAINRSERFENPSFQELLLNEKLVTLAREFGYEV